MSSHRYGMNQRSISAFLDDHTEDKEKSNLQAKQTRPSIDELNLRQRQSRANQPKPPQRDTRVRFLDEAQPNQGAEVPGVVKDYRESLAETPGLAIAVAAIKALTNVVIKSKATTMMGLSQDLKDAAALLLRCNETSISLRAGCELFLRYTTRQAELEHEDFSRAKQQIIKRGNDFATTSTSARVTISELGARFIRHNAVVMTHAYSRVVLEILSKAATLGVQFSVVVTEGRPDETGLQMAQTLTDLHIPVTVILDSGVAHAMESLKVDMVLIGAEGVVENGGIINKLGTLNVAIAAQAYKKPVYVAAESYKFARLYPLNQRDYPLERKGIDFGVRLPRGVKVETATRDYTPPNNITLLFTDLGVLTPAAVSDELIQLYV